jgi:radical SAM-linked protein
MHFDSDAAAEKIAVQKQANGKKNAEEKSQYWYRLHYAKQGDIRLLSHLEVIQVFFQAFRRAGVTLHFSQGFNPVPKASFSPALPVGTESLAEYLDVDLTEAISDERGFLFRINEQLPSGIKILSVAGVPDKKSDAEAKSLTCYSIALNRELSERDEESRESFMETESYTVTKIRKGKQRTLDIRKQVESLSISGNNSLEMILLSQEGQAASKPAEILKAVLALTDEEILDMNILKKWRRLI